MPVDHEAKAKRLLKQAEKGQPPKNPKKVRVSMKRWIETRLTIRPEAGGTELFILRKAQKRLLARFVKAYVKGQSIKWVILKSRQLGISTLIEAIIMWMAVHHPETAYMVVAQDKQSTRKIFNMTRRYYRYLPQDEKLPLTSPGEDPSQDSITFKHPHNSEISLATAGKGEVGRSATFKGVHCSEMAFFKHAKQTMTALNQAVARASRKGFTFFVVESTANGLNLFKQYWDNAQKTTSEWEGVFVSWKEDPDARIAIAPGEDFFLDETEAQYMEKNGLDLAQMKWARYMRDTWCHGSWEVFHQEYPVQAEYAFLYSGFAVFNHAICRQQLEVAQETKPVFVGDIEFGPSLTKPTVKLVADPYGPLTIWKMPEFQTVRAPDGKNMKVEKDYFGGVDSSEGGGTKADYSEIIILDDSVGVCCQYRNNKIRTFDFAIKVYLVGLFYHNAFMGVERNAVGASVLAVLEHGHPERDRLDPEKPKYPMMKRYPNLQTETKRLGFTTSKKSKWDAISLVAELHEHGDLNLWSTVLLLQMQGLVWEVKDTKQRYRENYPDEITKHGNDDGIISLAIANKMRLTRFGQRFCPKPVADDWEGVEAA
jgi:hypothetical protein